MQLPAIKEIVRVPCLDRASMPIRPGTSMPDRSADVARKANGASVDVDKLEKYADEMDAAVSGCFKLPQP